MALSVRTLTINNNSNQLITLNYGSIDPILNVTEIHHQRSGVLHIKPKTQITIEENRIDRGQVDNIATLEGGLISVQEGLVTSG
jgi:hypothetical protein